MNLGLVLTGGGARAAYQVGAIQALAELIPSHFSGGEQKKGSPFNVITGVSAGAINSAYLMSRADDFQLAAKGLWDLWANLHSERIYRSDAQAVAKLGSRWLRTVGMGSLMETKKANYLLNTEPLRELLKQELHLDRLPEFFKSGVLRGTAFSATSYWTGTAISFYDGIQEIEPWVRSTRLGVRRPLTLEHVMASSAIPVFFPPERLENGQYGDGCIRLTSPLSPAIHLGANKIIAIGIRYFRTLEQTVQLNQQNIKRDDLTIAEIGGVLLNAVFLDSLETDIERMERINRTLSLIPPEKRVGQVSLKEIPVLALRPSQDLGQMAKGTLHEFPTLIRFLLKGVGAKEDKGWDLLSYLAFEKVYTTQLLNLGYDDTIRQRDDILRFLEE